MLNPMIEFRDFLFKKEDPLRHPAMHQPRRRTMAGTNQRALHSELRARTKRSSDDTLASVELSTQNPLTPVSDGRTPSPVTLTVQKNSLNSPSTLSPKRMKSRSLPSFSDFAKIGGFGSPPKKGNKKRGLLGVIGESGSDDDEDEEKNKDSEE